tara:strand:+ start:211 stop:480 length:270 start_codon:yes stop_codon:yes gene_type:complete
LIITYLLQYYEARKVSFWFKIFSKFNGMLDPDAQMPRDLKFTFIGNKETLVKSIKEIISWNPERIILSHGRSYYSNGGFELKRAFRKIL